MKMRLKPRGPIVNFVSIRPATRDKTFSMSCPPPLALIETRICPNAGAIFFMFQRGLGLATEPGRMPEHLNTLSIPRFSLFDRTSRQFGPLDESPIKQGFFVNFVSDRLPRHQILSRDQRKQKWTWWGENVYITAYCRLG